MIIGSGRSPLVEAAAGRGDSGLTTLEWLLIVAAVAGLAALAVVLVQNVVGDTSEQIAGSSARETAAILAAEQIMINASDADQPPGVDNFGQWQSHWSNACNRLNITYGDAGITATPNFKLGSGSQAVPPGDPFDSAKVVKGTTEGGQVRRGGGNALAECQIA